jgi:hypothetical protein
LPERYCTPFDSVDALDAFKTRGGSCTSFANLGAAAGRANGLPTRTVANCTVDYGSQPTHCKRRCTSACKHPASRASLNLSACGHRSTCHGSRADP